MKRRGVIAAIAGAGVAIAAGLYRFTDLFVKHYPPTPYDDLLSRLVDREEAIRLGARMTGDFDVSGQAARLRATFANRDLATVVQADIAAGRLAEVDGWIVPQNLALLSALAAKV
jgi:hypothetical protein